MGAGDALGACLHELALFAAAGFLVAGVDDCVVDLLWLGRNLWRRATVYSRFPRATPDTLAPPRPGRLAIFVPAWAEEAVIGAMIGTARARLSHRDWRLYVGCYPNDPATIAAATAAAGGDPHVRIVIGDRPGPTTKAGCLNWLWQAMRADERAERRHVKAVVLHDAEDAVHRDELAVYDSLIDRFDMVQIPVQPAVVRGGGWWRALVSSSYCGEFAESHGKQVVVREAIGAAVPSAGVGCAVARHALARSAHGREGPFDPGTLTEDYEMGLLIGAAGGRGAMVRLDARDGRGLVAVSACFPATIREAVRQKARWITGIAFTGWDRLGWEGSLAERWMRLRDRRAPAAALVTAVAYLVAGLWLLAAAIAWTLDAPAPGLGLPAWVLYVTSALLVWRLVGRMWFAGRIYGWRMAALAPAHLLIGNLVAVGAASCALGTYMGIVRGGPVRWDKTHHVFPEGA